MDGPVLPSKLLTHLSLAADIVRSHNFIHVYSHFDTDGLTAAAIVAKALTREGKEFNVTIFPTLTEPQMQIIENTESECVLVTDLGASYIKRFDEMDCDVIVLDHHTVGDQATRICYANPHLYGINGSNAGCGASMAFLFAVQLDEKNWDLSPLAVTGMVGDKQHLYGMKGLNEYIFKKASEKGFAETRPGSLIPVGNLGSELYLCTEPFIKGVSGNAAGTEAFLKEAGLETNRDSGSLSDDEALRLSSMIAVKLIEQGVTRDKLEECARTRYYLPHWGTDAETLSSVINACGHRKQEGVGVAAGMGDRQALEDAKRLDSEFRKNVVEQTIANLDKIREMDNIQWFDSTESGSTGVICAIIMSYIGNPRKPTIGVNCAEAVAKTSSRGTYPLLERGLNLCEVMGKACSAVGGEGGGHNIASGGSFDCSKRDEFLKIADQIVGEQLKGKN